MNISCISCPARYGVPDAKLAGKRVRITCKRCGTVLLVDGSVNPPRVSSGANAGPSVAPVPRTSLAPTASPAPAAKAVEFLVVMPDDRQESADVAQIVRLYRDRAIDAESLIWRDGMDEWRKVWDVEEVSAAFRRMGYARPSQPTARPSRPAEASYDESSDASTHVVPSSHPPPAAAFDEDEATSVVDSSSIGFDPPLARAGAGVHQTTDDDDDPTGVAPSPMELAMAPQVAELRKQSDRPQHRATARSDRPTQGARRGILAEPTPSPEPAAIQRETRTRAQTRDDSRARQQGLDLFAAQAQRAAEQELAPAVEDDGSRLTGARGENSVLFSLDALVKQESQKQRPIVLPQRARTDESVLVDSSPSLPSGVVGSALVAPDFTAPVSAPPPRVTEAFGADDAYPQAKRSGGWLLPVIVVVLAGALGGGWLSGRLQPLLAAIGLPITVPGAPSAAPSASAAPESTSEKPPAEEAASAAPEASAAPSASASGPATASATPPPTGVAAAPARPSGREPSTTSSSGEAPAPKESATKPAGGGGAFDTAAAKTALTAAASNASSCREATGPLGSGKVSITFAPSGRPTSVAVTGDLAGTSVGSCVARLFRAARVPPFSGDPVSVSKAFSVK